MNKYDVYGIGNALVDLEYRIEIADLAALQIDKGLMTLVDAQQQLRIITYLGQRSAHRSCGGSAANSMIALSQCGGSGFYTCNVAADALGDFYLNDLVEHGVATHLSAEREGGDTGRCVVLVTPDTDRTMCTYLGVSSNLSPQLLVADALRSAHYFYMEGYLATDANARATCIAGKQIAAAAGVQTALSLSDPNIVRYCKSGLLEMIGDGVDLIFANADEAQEMAGTHDLQAAVTYLQSISREFVITRGAQGALVWDGANLNEMAAVTVTAVDTLGAGDMFAGAFLYGRCRAWSHQQAAGLAASAAAKVVSQFGPRLTIEQTQALLQNWLKQQ